MAINQAFLGHSIFAQLSIRGALTRFQGYGAAPGSPPPTDTQRIDRFIQAIKDMDIRNVWIQLFSRPGDVEDNDTDRKLRTALIAALGQAGIGWAGWGYCAGKNSGRDKGLVQQFQNDLKMSAFMIDAEPGNKVYPNPKFPKDPSKNLPDIWKEADFDDFTSSLQKEFGIDNLALTTWPVLQIQDDVANGIPLIALMKIAAPRVCAFVPQAYWMNYPTTVHYGFGLSKNDYPPNDPVSFVRLVLKSWSMLGFTQPLIVAGQSYWGEGGPNEAIMDGKLGNFTSKFADWAQILGFGWYHAGTTNTPKNDSMSDTMISTIKQARLGGKPYEPPPASPASAPAMV